MRLSIPLTLRNCTVFNGNFEFNWPVIGEYQAGFRSPKATMDQIFIVKNLLEKA
jgi:hypothetical protein